MKYYLPAMICIGLLYLSGYGIIHWQRASLEKEQVYFLEIQREIEALNHRLLASQDQTNEARSQFGPYKAFTDSWDPYVKALTLPQVLKTLDELTAYRGLGIGYRGSSQAQSSPTRFYNEKMHLLTLGVMGEYDRACEFLKDIAYQLPLLRLESLQIKGIGRGRVDLALEFRFPEL